jgi:hypothetical protein
MQPVPFDLPLRPNEAASLAGLIFQQAPGRRLTDDLRNRLAGQAATLGLSSFRPWFGSLEPDPIHTSAFYLAVDGLLGARPEPLLLHLASSSAPTSALFRQPVLIGRMRPGGERELVVNAIPFSPRNEDALEQYVNHIGAAFLPRPQGAFPAISVTALLPGITLPAAFQAYRTIFKTSGVNLAAITAGLSATSARQTYHAGLWAAIRSGWREGYTVEGPPITVASDSLAAIDAVREAIRRSAFCTKFTVDASCLLDPLALTERGWNLGEFSRTFEAAGAQCSLPDHEIQSLAARFSRPLQIAEELYDCIAEVKNGRAFDFEFALDRTATPTEPEDLLFCLHWLKSRGRPAQFIAPKFGAGESASRVPELAAVARHFGASLSIASADWAEPSLLQEIGRATGGRVNFKLTAGALLHLLEATIEDLEQMPEPLLEDARRRIAAHIVGLSEHLH